MKRSALIFILSAPLLLLAIYYPVFTSDYVYLDEAPQLWHHGDGSTAHMFLSQGRWLTGLLLETVFKKVHVVGDLRGLRLVALAGWLGFIVCWWSVFRSWTRRMCLDPLLLPFSLVFIAAAPTTTISIGWASCLELPFATTCALVSGAWLSRHLAAQRAAGHDRVNFPLPVLLMVMLPGLASLFLYQNTFGVFLVPFVLDHFINRNAATRRSLAIAIIMSLLICLIYFFIYKYGLTRAGIEASGRTAISHDPLKKIAYFFSGPLPMAFNLNYLYSAQTLLPQVIAPFSAVIMLVCIFTRFKMIAFAKNVAFILLILSMLALIYLPSMISTENFASYRTLGPLGLMVFLLLISSILQLISSRRVRAGLVGVVSISLALLGHYNFDQQFTRPLSNEYRGLTEWVDSSFQPGGPHAYPDTILLIRADKRLFRERDNIRSSRDEFGLPSTSRDWVPVPLVKQLVMEKTGSHAIAERLVVLQYADRTAFDALNALPGAGSRMVDMNAITPP